MVTSLGNLFPVGADGDGYAVMRAVAVFLASRVGASCRGGMLDAMAGPHALRLLASLRDYERHGDAARFRRELLRD